MGLLRRDRSWDLQLIPAAIAESIYVAQIHWQRHSPFGESRAAHALSASPRKMRGRHPLAIPARIPKGRNHETYEPVLDGGTCQRRVCASPDSGTDATAPWLGRGAQSGYRGVQGRDSPTLSGPQRKYGS